MADFKIDVHCENEDYMRFVKEILKMPYLNRLKQFLLRLLRNNLLLGKRAEKNINPEESKCYICGEHKESRVLLFLGCTSVQKKIEFLKRVLKKAGLLRKGCEMSLFFFKDYDINSVENIALATLWNFTYNNKYNKLSSAGDQPCMI